MIERLQRVEDPQHGRTLVDDIELRQLHGHFANLRNFIAQAAASMPGHGAWLDRNAPLALAIEFVIMLFAAILAMLTDNWFSASRKPPSAG